MNGTFALDDGAVRVLLVLARVLLDHVRAFHDGPLFLDQDFNNATALAFFRAGDDDDLVALFYVSCHNQMTSGASEMIFMNFLSRSSRATGPKMRVPFGLSSLSMITQALLSNRRYEPSLRRMALRVRTTTALCTSPFLTCPSGAASLIWTLMMSPMCA